LNFSTTESSKSLSPKPSLTLCTTNLRLYHLALWSYIHSSSICAAALRSINSAWISSFSSRICSANSFRLAQGLTNVNIINQVNCEREGTRETHSWSFSLIDCENSNSGCKVDNLLNWSLSSVCPQSLLISTMSGSSKRFWTNDFNPFRF